MSKSNNSVSPLRQRMIEDMTMRKLNQKTQDAYIRNVCEAAQLSSTYKPTNLNKIRTNCIPRTHIKQNNADKTYLHFNGAISHEKIALMN